MYTFILFSVILFSSVASVDAQTKSNKDQNLSEKKQVNGIVKDAAGNPLPGVTIKAENVMWAVDFYRSVMKNNFLISETNAQSIGWGSKGQYSPFDSKVRLEELSNSKNMSEAILRLASKKTKFST